MTFRAFRQFRPKLLDPTKNRRAINIDAAFAQKICYILIRKWVPQIHPHRAQNDQCRKTVTFEWLFSMHNGPLASPELAFHKLMQQSRHLGTGQQHRRTGHAGRRHWAQELPVSWITNRRQGHRYRLHPNRNRQVEWYRSAGMAGRHARPHSRLQDQSRR